MEKFTLQGVYIGKLEKCELFELPDNSCKIAYMAKSKRR